MSASNHPYDEGSLLVELPRVGWTLGEVRNRDLEIGICGLHVMKRITDNQLIGELGETAVKKRFLAIGFQFDARGRLEAGIDGFAEIMINGRPTGRMIAVQIKSTRDRRYSAETETSFSYTLNSKDLEYWRTCNLPIILVVYRQSDNSMFWSRIPTGPDCLQSRLCFDKARDALDKSAITRLAALTVAESIFSDVLRQGSELDVRSESAQCETEIIAEAHRKLDLLRSVEVDRLIQRIGIPRQQRPHALTDEQRTTAILDWALEQGRISDLLFSVDDMIEKRGR